MAETLSARDRSSDKTSHGLREFLNRSHGNSIVLLAQDLSHWYVSELVAGANQAAFAHGYKLITLDFHRSPDRERELLQAIKEAQVDACIFLWDHAPINLDLYAEIAAKCVCIQLGDRKSIPFLDHVTSDDYGGAVAAMHHLASVGYETIGHVTLFPPIEAVQARERAYVDTLKLRNLPFNERWLLSLPYGLTDADRTRRAPQIRRFLNQAQLPRALFVCSDWLASEVIECALDMGLRIPEDIALVGFDDAQPYSMASIPLTTVRVDLRQSGHAAVERIMSRLHSGTNEVTVPCQILISPTLVVRASSARLIPTNKRLDSVMRHIQEHYREDLPVYEVARQFGFDPNYFSHLFAQVFGKRFTDYVNQLRLQYAAELLLTTDYTIDHIAHAAGFHAQNHFYRLFKRVYFSSPDTFRKQKTFR